MLRPVFYFTIIIVTTLIFSGNLNARYIVEEKVPLVFNGTLRSIDSSSTAIFEIKNNLHYLKLLENAGLDKKHFGFINKIKTDFIIRVAVAGAPNKFLSNSDMIKIAEGIKEVEYELTCYSVDYFQKKGQMPVCYIVSRLTNRSFLEILHNISYDFLPLDYQSIQKTPELIDLIRKVEKKLIISDFLI